MKKIFLLFITLLSVSAIKAQNNQFINLNAGFLFKSTLNASIGYERELNYGNAFEIYGEVGNRWHKDPIDGKVYKDTFWKEDYYWDGGILYKKCLKRYKNSTFRLRGGAQCGAHKGDYFFGAELGFEYNYVFINGLQFTIIQKNQVNFRSGDTFKNGLLIGLKIPF